MHEDNMKTKLVIKEENEIVDKNALEEGRHKNTT